MIFFTADQHLFHHGEMKSYGKSFDIGVDTNNFYPYLFNDIKAKMNKITVTEYVIYNGK